MLLVSACHYVWLFNSLVFSSEIVNEVEARMNRQHTPPSLLTGPNPGASTSMSMSNCVGVANNAQARPTAKASRERRSGLATVMEGAGFIHLGSIRLIVVTFRVSCCYFDFLFVVPYLSSLHVAMLSRK